MATLAAERVTDETALRLSDRLRARYPAALVADGLTLQRLRDRAAVKFSRAADMMLTRDGLEQTVNAIYELDGDELKIAMPLAPAKGSGAAFENKRPEGFETTKDKPEMMMKLTRAK